jgi:hypothetical protein
MRFVLKKRYIMSRFALRMALVACVLTVLTLAPLAQAGIVGRVWVQSYTDARIHVWAEVRDGGPVDLGWVDPHGCGWLNGTLDDRTYPEEGPPTTHLHAQSEDGAHSWDQDVGWDAQDYIWNIQ